LIFFKFYIFHVNKTLVFLSIFDENLSFLGSFASKTEKRVEFLDFLRYWMLVLPKKPEILGKNQCRRILV
jgi:hypothetical protein